MSFLPILLTSCISAILRKSFIVNSMFMETHDADFAEYPSIVFFKRELHLEVSCLGSLCRCVNFTGYILSGTLSRTNPNCIDSCEYRRVGEIHVHGGFYKGSSNSSDDIALVKLMERFSGATGSESSPLAYERPYNWDFAISFGFLNDRNKLVDTLQVGIVKVLPFVFCADTRTTNHEKLICLSSRFTIGGGPIIYEGLIVGLASFSVENEKYGLIATDILHHSSFIDDYVKVENTKRMALSGGRILGIQKKHCWIKITIFLILSIL
ncbi:uncharacterized protein LOC119655482 isoform X1 [Hermetia illucens]|uniref:uncharacterized protein LOC119655482 isoform X1 n=1 Tax=Hermetia illucens TaxID=343691 RepID=UPI0018CC14AC|nr:uncharacterized protein LOC119655482 isoform X1 [Hermetia illucens]